jgi:DNA-binding IclR family transcriptional regulator
VLDAAEQVTVKGYCTSTGDWGQDIVVAAAPLVVPDLPALVIGCAAPASALPRAKLMEFVGPRLVTLADNLRRLRLVDDSGEAGHA